MQQVKRRTRYRSTDQPEKVIAKDICTATALAVLKARYKDVKDFDEHCPGYRKAAMTGPAFDDEHEQGNENDDSSRLLNKGRRATIEEWVELKEKLRLYASQGLAEGWVQEDFDLPLNYDHDGVHGGTCCAIVT